MALAKTIVAVQPHLAHTYHTAARKVSKDLLGWDSSLCFEVRTDLPGIQPLGTVGLIHQPTHGHSIQGGGRARPAAWGDSVLRAPDLRS